MEEEEEEVTRNNTNKKTHLITTRKGEMISQDFLSLPEKRKTLKLKCSQTRSRRGKSTDRQVVKRRN